MTYNIYFNPPNLNILSTSEAGLLGRSSAGTPDSSTALPFPQQLEEVSR